MKVAWENDEVSMGIFNAKYSKDKETPEQFCKRVASIVPAEIRSSVESMLADGTFMFGGRTLYIAGRDDGHRASSSNCYVLPSPEDNLESIYDINKKMARVFSMGGGVGITIDKLRPKGAKVHNGAHTSTGAVSFLNVFNTTGEVVGANGRRAAIMVALDCNHPDIEEFLHIKEENNKLSAMNISIKFTRNFMEAVQNNEDVTLYFLAKDTGEVSTKVINAKKFWDDFCKVNWDYGDPGCIFIDRVRDWNMLSGYDNYLINVSNPCLRGDTEILTDKGYVPIEQLDSKPVKVWNGEEWSEVIPHVTGINQPMLTISFSNGASVDCTPYHKWIMKDGTRQEASQLKVGDAIDKFDLPLIDTGIHQPNMYTSGFYAGDGTRGMNQIVLYDEKRDLLGKLNYLSKVDYKNQYRVRINPENTILNKDFVPDTTYDIESRLQWLAGLIDSDGTRQSADGGVSITSINRLFLDSVRLMLTTLGVHSKITLMSTGGKRLLPNGHGGKDFYHCKPCYRLLIPASAVVLLNELGLKCYRVNLEFHPKRDARRFITVTGIHTAPVAEAVYCLNEPKRHAFVANGMLTGNCSEFFGNDYSACNLGSLNLYHFVDNPFTPEATFNFNKFKTAVKVAINALNAVLDYGYDRQPFDENRECITDWRQIGLGVFGYADMLVAMCQRYGSRDAIRLTADVFSTMQEMAIHESAVLAAKDGPFKQYDYNKTAASAMFRSLPDTLQYVVKRMGLRNGALLSIAPSGSISLLAGRYSGGCEPLYKLYYERTSHKMEDSGKSFKIYSKSIEDLLKFNNLPLDLTTEEIEEKFPWVIESQQIPIADRVSTQSVMQMFIDNAISSTVNLPEDATPEDISNVYISAYLNGCKGITVFRDNCKRGNILGVKHDEPAPVVLHDSIKPEHRSNIGVLTGKTFTVKSGDGTNLYVTINWKDGKMFEVFVSTERHAHEVAGITRIVSLAMRCGVSIQSIIEQLFKLSADSIGFAIGTALNDAYAFEDTEQLVQEVEVTKHKDGFVCPECGGKDVKLVGHCWECAVCGAGGCSV